MTSLLYDPATGETNIKAWADQQWAAEDAAAQAHQRAAEAKIRRVARHYGLALATMDRHHARGRTTVETFRRAFRGWLGILAGFDRDAAHALRREVSDLMDERERYPHSGAVEWADETSDPDEAFEAGYACAWEGHADAMPAIGYDPAERRAFKLGVATALVDLESEGALR
jgi:hypothetical protein